MTLRFYDTASASVRDFEPVVPGEASLYYCGATVQSGPHIGHVRSGLVFVPVPEGKTTKNRLHIDLAPHISQDRDAQIEDLLARGATRVDVGQDEDVTWTVLADPEGNEFCVLSSRDR